MKSVGKTMINTIKKERLQEIAEDGFLKHGESKELARIALAAMGGELHTDDELSNLLWYSQEATCHSDPNYYCEFQRLATPGLIAGIIRELQESRKADSEPVAYADPMAFVNFEAGNARREWMWKNPGADLVPLYRHAQPAPVVPNGLRLALSNAGIAAPESDEMLAATCEKHIQALVTWVKDRKPFQSAPVVPSFEEWLSAANRKPLGWVKDAMREAYDACRAAMLQAGNSPVIPDGYVMVPKEPTQAMCAAFNDSDYGRKSLRERYVAMLAAAPQEVK